MTDKDLKEKDRDGALNYVPLVLIWICQATAGLAWSPRVNLTIFVRNLSRDTPLLICFDHEWRKFLCNTLQPSFKIFQGTSLFAETHQLLLGNDATSAPSRWERKSDLQKSDVDTMLPVEVSYLQHSTSLSVTISPCHFPKCCVSLLALQQAFCNKGASILSAV